MDNSNTIEIAGVVKGIAQRATARDPLVEVSQCRVLRNTGLEAEGRLPGKRSITLLAVESWARTCRELGVKLPWYTRRANLLIEGIDLSATVGRPVMIGPVRVWIHAETRPCKLMDELHQGLRAALKPNFRGGVYGQVLTEGTIRVGDGVDFAASP